MNESKFEFINGLNKKQKEICKSNENIILKACPGSGKTRTLTYRLAYISMINEPSRKLNIAITYTNRAADEIKDRLCKLDLDIKNIWAGTIHQFCLEFIIRPYSMYCKRISCGYHIIDEYVKNEYLTKIVDELGMPKKVIYNNPLSIIEIEEKYNKKLEENNEIDFEQILSIAHKLLSDNKFIRENISDIIRSIHVDEYQDTNELQYNILSYIVNENKKINVLFVGDIDQAIYGGIGGVAKEKIDLERQFGIIFVEKTLNGCYRSCQRIIDYYLEFQQEYNPIKSLAKNKYAHGHISFETNISKNVIIQYIAEIVKEQIEKGVQESEICILAPQWYLLYPISKNLKTLLPNINFDAPDITPIKYDPMNVFYLISRLVFTEAGYDISLRKRSAKDLISIFEQDYKIRMPENVDSLALLKSINSFKLDTSNGIEYLKKAIEYLLFNLKINLKCEKQLKKSYEDFIDKVEDRIKNYKLPVDIESLKKCFKEKHGVVISTFHGVKGEEYTTVIALGLLKGYIPHWNLVCNHSESECKNETKKLIYVICSRAKENLFLFSEQGRTTNTSGRELEITQELKEYQYNYDRLDSNINEY